MGVLVFIINQEFSISWNHQEFFIDETVIVFYEARTRLLVLVPRLISFFFFFFLNFILCFRFDSARFVLTRLLFSLIRAESGLFSQNQAVLAESGCIGWLLKQAEIGLESCQNNWNWLWMRPKHPKSIFPQFYFEYLLLILCFLFCFVLSVYFNFLFILINAKADMINSLTKVKPPYHHY